MTRIYLIRHAEAEGNLYRRAQGQYDSNLTALGERQLERLACRFADVPLDAVYSSDLRRAYKTAEAVAAVGGLSVIAEPSLRELNMGRWEDKPWGELEETDPEQMLLFGYDPAKWSVDGAESVAQLTSRITNAVMEVAARHDGETVAVVTHGMAIRSFICGALGVPSGETRRIHHGDNTSVAFVSVDGDSISVEYYNDNSHLDEGDSTFARQQWWRDKRGTDGNNLWFLPLDLDNDTEAYISCYRDSWKAAYGSLAGYDEKLYLDKASEHSKSHPGALVRVMRGSAFAGIVELDIERERKAGAGWITLCCLSQPNRGQGLGVQLLGHAVSVFRALGRSSLRLHVAPTNAAALRFYTRCGFTKIGCDDGAMGKVLLLEKTFG